MNLRERYIGLIDEAVAGIPQGSHDVEDTIEHNKDSLYDTNLSVSWERSPEHLQLALSIGNMAFSRVTSMEFVLDEATQTVSHFVVDENSLRYKRRQSTLTVQSGKQDSYEGAPEDMGLLKLMKTAGRIRSAAELIERDQAGKTHTRPDHVMPPAMAGRHLRPLS